MTPSAHPHRKLFLILASLRFSGGVTEALRLAEDLQARSIPVCLIVLWRSEHELPCPNLPVVYLSSFRTTDPAKLLQYLYFLAAFLLFVCKDSLTTGQRSIAVLLTHFSTFPFGWIAPWAQRYCFNQDIEWMFVPPGLPRRIVRRIILATSRRSLVVTTSSHVDRLYRDHGVQSIGQVGIWARETWLQQPTPTERDAERDIDVMMFVRRGRVKRLDLCHAVLERLKEAGISTLAVAPDPEIHRGVLPLATHAALCPTDDELRDLYRRSKIFLLLSDLEGFALPPLEAMGAGCVPLCRDCGGPRSYMDGAFAAHLIPLDANPTYIVQRVEALLADPVQLDALSGQARQRFAEGLALSRRLRSVCIDAFAQNLRLP
jgi:glycosyltransferase involved in cell wall biosynthesis